MLSLMYLKLGRTESEFPFDYKGSGTVQRAGQRQSQNRVPIIEHSVVLCTEVHAQRMNTHVDMHGSQPGPVPALPCFLLIIYFKQVPSLLTREFDFDVNRGWSLKQ